MIQQNRNPKKCKFCGKDFTPWRPLAIVCSPKCADDYASEMSSLKAEKDWKDETKRRRKAAETPQDRRRQAHRSATKAFNTWVRTRDAGKPCHSCGQPISPPRRGGKVQADAGHWRSVASAPHMRYHLLNCWLQCVKCNRELSGNALEFRKVLLEKLGPEQLERIEYDQKSRLSDPQEMQRLAFLLRKRTRWYLKRRGGAE